MSDNANVSETRRGDWARPTNANPEISYTKNTGAAVVRMQIAVNSRRKGKEVAYDPLKALGKTAEFANQYLTKGSGLLVEGRLQNRTYEKDGQKRSRLRGSRRRAVAARSQERPCGLRCRGRGRGARR